MSARIGAAVCSRHDALEATLDAARETREALAGAPADLALVFASGAHLAAPEAVLEAVHATLEPRALVGCGAGGVLGVGREHEAGTAVAVWAASFSGAGSATPFWTTVGEEGELDGLPTLEGASGAILLTDPYSFPADDVLSALAAAAPAVPVIGGLSSGRTPAGTGALFFEQEVCEEGAVGVRFDGVEMLPCVSQGAAPLGPEVTVTRAEGNIIHELAGRPALETVQRIISELPLHERALVASGLLVGIVIDSGKPEYEQGDFLVRGVLGADTDTGRIAIGAAVHEGQIIRLHARDAGSADEDLRRALRLRVEAMAGAPPAGAVVFSCNGRGSAMFGTTDHDAAMIDHELQGAPTAGFFAAGEIGPVGGRSFLHGFTATVALFAR
jgi:small ligand-binding sensory domain FIST